MRMPMSYLLMAASMLIAVPSAAVTIDYSGIGAYRDTEPLDGNFNNGVYVNNGTTAWFPVHRSLTSGDAARTAFEFDISAFEAVSSAVVQIPYSFAINAPTIEVHGYQGNGVVTRSDAIGDNLLGSANLPNSFNGPLASVQFDVTSFVRSLLDVGAPYAGFSVRIADDLVLDATQVTNVWSGRVEHTPSGRAPGPQLQVLNVPEPSTLSLLAAATVLLLVASTSARRNIQSVGRSPTAHNKWLQPTAIPLREMAAAEPCRSAHRLDSGIVNP